MVIVQLMGGIGNQLFQYAIGYSLARKNQSKLKLDVSWYKNNPSRQFRVDKFCISAKIATINEVLQLTGLFLNDSSIKSKFMNNYQLRFNRAIIRERGCEYNPKVLETSGNIYLIGYWQSEKYFKEYEAELRKEFFLKERVSEVTNSVAQAINKSNSISIHVRRGDYVSNPETLEFHGLSSLDYYFKSINTFTQIIDDPKFFVFSDDIDWVKQNLKLNYPVQYVVHNGLDKDYEDLWLISQCKYHILANSSFSWWGAWLSRFPQKIVFAPKNWFKTKRLNTNDLIPNNWLKI